jgi:hypothetical protein
MDAMVCVHNPKKRKISSFLGFNTVDGNAVFIADNQSIAQMDATKKRILREKEASILTSE